MLSTKKYRHKEFTQRKNIFFGYFYANNLVISNKLLTHTHTHSNVRSYARVRYAINPYKQKVCKKFFIKLFAHLFRAYKHTKKQENNHSKMNYLNWKGNEKARKASLHFACN